ncbi:hypothetical protein OCU04_000273 [Sclerotinia nivalis]|uniref:CDP-diacylglycerol--inositol 3-phosphatidyltransferase n=1 Tax=Sclerotinia nivalis TaxID=352851 RepID=A0A9X0DNK5_9HELO|nr:hypothetical protein OCU04_000273 [Sclerotinia nivalis]
MPLHPRTCSFLYTISCLLDAADGAAARKFNQSTRFGAVLDMVIDRCTTSSLMVFLASAFPRWSIIFQILISLDLASHYMHMYATLAMGGSSHKQMDKKVPRAMQLYYTNKNVLFTVCAMNELFFIALYLLSFSAPIPISSMLQTDGQLGSITPGNLPDPSLIWASPWSAGWMETARANKMDSSGPWILLYILSIFMLFKQYVNIIQLIEASKRHAEGDVELRKKSILAQDVRR